ncbi:MAG: superoxide dismutase family protein [Eubacteriaceae bacterium]|nr:superoxide dismutase family protein [Eubacteriaceae bacterium]
MAFLRGGRDNKNLFGTVSFTQKLNGVLVTTEVFNLPVNDQYKSAFHGYHIHFGSRCSGDEQDEFAYTGGHYNPQNYPHSYHAGDLPPLLSNNGYAYSSFLTNRFNVDDIIGRTVIIHADADDFTTQPSGNSGKKIACGEIIKA